MNNQSQQDRRKLNEEHQPAAIQQRINDKQGQSYTRDAVLGAIDGCVTTFAIVAGTAGGHFTPVVTVVLGVANLLADGFSMAASEYQATRAEAEEVATARREEQRHLETIPHGEREEVRQIYRRKGFEGETLNRAVQATTGNHDTWLDTMLTDELGLQPHTRDPRRAAGATFLAFIAAGVVPLLPFIAPQLSFGRFFLVSSILTGVMFFLIGMAKGTALQLPRLHAAFETLITGSLAAALAYTAGWVLKSIYGEGVV
ncbi:MAG: hypothetical protein GF398_10865 [Chitinivibrionales bacterium]|nr:hypothetical protein [Chitinivibrionales bacterium]